MVVVRVDSGCDLVRSTLPKLMPDDRRAWPLSCPRTARLGVTTMTIHNEDPREPLTEQRTL
jgi:hypothetical protein